MSASRDFARAVEQMPAAAAQLLVDVVGDALDERVLVGDHHVHQLLAERRMEAIPTARMATRNNTEIAVAVRVASVGSFQALPQAAIFCVAYNARAPKVEPRRRQA